MLRRLIFNNMFNIFQGNDLLKKTVAKSLGYDLAQKSNSFTKDMYFQTFFYLCKRFGNPSFFDDYKEAGWSFKVKNYFIEIRMNSIFVEIMMYGKYSNLTVHSPYIVKYNRERQKKRELLLNETDNWNETEEKISEVLFEKFINEYNINKKITQEEFDKDYGMKWYDFICRYNNSIVNVDYKAIVALYGHSYKNAYIRHAIKTLDQFLKNMLTPIYIRDVAYNIKGRISDDQATDYGRFENNIKIEFDNE